MFKLQSIREGYRTAKRLLNGNVSDEGAQSLAEKLHGEQESKGAYDLGAHLATWRHPLKLRRLKKQNPEAWSEHSSGKPFASDVDFLANLYTDYETPKKEVETNDLAAIVAEYKRDRHTYLEGDEPYLNLPETRGVFDRLKELRRGYKFFSESNRRGIVFKEAGIPRMCDMDLDFTTPETQRASLEAYADSDVAQIIYEDTRVRMFVSGETIESTYFGKRPDNPVPSPFSTGALISSFMHGVFGRAKNSIYTRSTKRKRKGTWKGLQSFVDGRYRNMLSLPETQPA